VYLQGVALFMAYLIGITVFFGTRSLEHFWSGILDPVGAMVLNAVTRYWSVFEKNTLMLPLDFSGYSPGVFLYNRILWLTVGVAAWLPSGHSSRCRSKPSLCVPKASGPPRRANKTTRISRAYGRWSRAVCRACNKSSG
jgi:hypothetical protein